MLESLAPENERDPYPCQSPKTLPGIASLSPDKHPALPHPQLHQTQPCDISPQTPYDTAIPLHYGSYEYTRSREYFTPQGAGNKSRRDLKLWLRVNSELRQDSNLSYMIFSIRDMIA